MRLCMNTSDIIVFLIKNNNKRMEKLVRYRKAFYEKENDLQHCNKKKEKPLSNHLKQTQLEKAYLTNPNPNHHKPNNITHSYCSLYAQQLLSLPQYAHPMNQFLNNHSINASLRARMLDWMVEVNYSYKFSNKTYFDGVSLMDRYFKAQTESLPPAKLHLVGVQSMLIATKMQEVYPLKIKTVYEKIAHKKLSLDELIQTQGRIMKTLHYQLNTWSFFDLAMLKLSIYVNSKDNKVPFIQSTEKIRQQQLQCLQQLCSYLSKFVLYDYRFYVQHPMLLMAQSIVKACFEIQGITVHQNFFTSSPIVIELSKQKIVQIVKCFGDRFEGLNNIFKFTQRQVINKVNQFVQ